MLGLGQPREALPQRRDGTPLSALDAFGSE
jgi:hypothetical protein